MKKPKKKEERIKVPVHTPIPPGTVGVVVHGRWVNRPDQGRLSFQTTVPLTIAERPVLRGWLGAINSWSRTALGVFVVVDYIPKAGPAYLRWTSDEVGWVRLRRASEEEVWEWLEEQLPERWRWRMRELVENAMGRLDMD